MRLPGFALAFLFSLPFSLAQSPLPKATAEEIKALNAQLAAENDLLVQINAASQAKDWQKAKELEGKALAADSEIAVQHPNLKVPGGSRPALYKAMGDTELNLGQYQDAIHAYETSAGLLQDLIAASGSDQPDAKSAASALRRTLGQVLTNEGNGYLKLRKNKEATECYRRAAEIASEIDPKMAATSWFNLCATLYNAGDVDAVPAACNKAIQADPTRADAYFVKGSALFSEGKDVKGKYVAPPESIDALKKYLELAPAGGHVADVKQMLEMAESGK